MEDASPDYQPGIVKDAGFGQNPENPAPPLFLESIALDQDCSVYGSLFVTNNGTFGKDVLIQMNLNVGGNVTVTGTIASGGNGNFSGVVAAAGGFASGNPMKLPGASLGGALNKLTGALNLGGLLKAASGILSEGQITGPLMQVAEKLTVGQPPDTGSDSQQQQQQNDTPPAEFYFNKVRYIPQEIFDTRSGEYYTVLAASKTSSN
jgi:hypothetical protein